MNIDDKDIIPVDIKTGFRIGKSVFNEKKLEPGF